MYTSLFSFQWYCHFDDDMYVNVPQLSNVLRQYDPEKPWYISSKTRNVVSALLFVCIALAHYVHINLLGSNQGT